MMTHSFFNDLGYSYRALAREPTGNLRGLFYVPEHLTSGPLVSCVMATRGRLMPARFAIECFQRQSYRDRELIVVCQRPGSEVEHYLKELADPRIRFGVAEGAETVGDMRNFARSICGGELISVWDDDDLSAPHRLSSQLNLLLAADAIGCFLLREMVWWPREGRLVVTGERLFEENTMLVRRDFLPPYPTIRRGGDTLLLEQLQPLGTLVGLDDPAAYVYIYHGGNIWDRDHFDGILDFASARFVGEDYSRIVDQLAATLPMRAYEEGLMAGADR